jgi:hypothetical protein
MEKQHITNRISELLRSLPGVIDCVPVEETAKEGIKEKEHLYEQSQLVELKNIGIYTVLQRELLFVLLKDRSFRPPPAPTIYLAEEIDQPAEEADQCITIGNRIFRIVGQEIIGNTQEFREKTISFGDGFLLFPERRAGREKRPAHFVIPPIPFPELAAKEQDWNITNCMSVSPSTLSDDYLREAYDFPRKPEYATILIGCDTE